MVKLYEYEGKKIFSDNGIAIPSGLVVSTPEEAVNAAIDIGFPVALKIQIYSGKRGKSGGIIFAENVEEVSAGAQNLLGQVIKGFIVEKLLVEKKYDIMLEYYAAVMSNPNTRKPVVVLSNAGGVDIEESAEGHTTYYDVDILKGFRSYEARTVARRLGVKGKEMMQISSIMVKMYDIYRTYDCKLVEINPLASTSIGIIALDAKVEVDDDAIYRQTALNIAPGDEVGDREPTELEDAAGEIDSNDHRGSAHFVQIDPDLEYITEIGKIPIGFDGVGTGVSLVMMDELVPYGFYPVNFCDTSGNPTASKLYRITRIIFQQKGIQGYVFISCISSQQLDNTARGIIKALKEIYPKTNGCPDIPCLFVFRGAWDIEAIKMFEDHGLTECKLIKVCGRDTTEKEAAKIFNELYLENYMQ